MGLPILNPKLTYAKLAYPPILVEQARELF